MIAFFILSKLATNKPNAKMATPIPVAANANLNILNAPVEAPTANE